MLFPFLGKTQEIQIHVHEVQRGESLERIAAKYDVTIDELQSNNIFLDKHFYVGQLLNVPIKVKPQVERSYSNSYSYDYDRVRRENKKQRRKTRANNFLRGLASAFSMGMTSYSQSLMFSPSYSNLGGGTTGNLDYLLDPNLAIMQTQQRMAQEQALNQQLINVSIQQVQQQEQQEYQQAKQFRPDLTIEQFRQEKAQAYQIMKEAERFSDSSYSNLSSTSSSSGGSSLNHTCSLCHGTGKIVKESVVSTFGLDTKVHCDQCGRDYYRSSGHSHITCTQCHGKGHF